MTILSRVIATAMLGAASLAATAAPAATIVRYDIVDERASGFGGWSNTYSGTTVTGTNGLTNFVGGSGTLNDGILPGNVGNNHLFYTSDGSSITAYFASLQTISVIEILSGLTTGNTIPGNITAAVVTIGGISQRVVSTGFGATAGSGQPVNERFVLTGALASAVGGSFTLSQVETSGDSAVFYAIGELTATSADATAGVPEPATWAMMLLGFGGMGFALRRRAATQTRIRFA